MFNLESAIKHCEVMAKKREEIEEAYRNGLGIEIDKRSLEYKQLAEWLKELKAYREFADWLVKAVLEEDWEDSSDFYAEVLCRKLTKLGKLKVVDNKYMEVKADEDSD